ncbi:MAG: PAS domain S-box protein, partial [Sphingobacteriaceae bacterium]
AVSNALEKYRLDYERQRASDEMNLLFNTIDEVFFSQDLVTSKLIQISPACEQVFGYSAAEIMADPDIGDKIVHPEDKQLQEESFQKIYSGDISMAQYRIIHKDKSIRWIESKLVPGLNAAGKVVRLNGVARDITERKNTEEQIYQNHIQLQEASETQAAILNALPPSIALLNEHCKIMAVNQSWKKAALINNLGIPNYGVGYSYLAIAEKAIGVDRASWSKIEKGIKDVIAGTKRGFSAEYVTHLSTEKKYFQVLVAPLADHKQKGAVVLHIDVTDQKLAEASLVQSEANLRSIFENTDQAIVLLDTNFNIVSFNTNASVLSVRNFHKKLKVGKKGILYFPNERKSRVKEMIAHVMNHQMVSYETIYDLADGSVEWYEVKWVGVVNEKNETIGIILTLKNITDKKIADIERDKITADLVQRNKDLEQFTYIVSHNLRAPVANILGLSNLLNDVDACEDESQEVLKALSNSVTSLDKVILDLNNILQVSQEVNDKVEQVSLPDLVEEIRSGISQMMDKNRVTLTYDFSEVGEILTLKTYLYSIFQNLIINSIKYRRADTDPVISIKSKLNTHRVCIFFDDNSKGIDLAKYGPHIFGLYKRFDTSVEGKGMGLFMVKKQVESLGGSISVKSELNKGTEFKVELPKSQGKVFDK